MTTDITFCTNNKCPLMDDCERNPDRLSDTSVNYVSMCDFQYSHDRHGQVVCSHFKQLKKGRRKGY